MVSLQPALAFVPMDRVHGQLGCGAQCSALLSPCGSPSTAMSKEEARGAYKRRRSSTVARDRIFSYLPTRKEDEDSSFPSFVLTIAITVPSASTLYCYLHKQQYSLAGRSGFTSTRGP